MDRRIILNRFTKLSNQLAGMTLIVGPALYLCAALFAAAGIGTTTGRWYDNQLEGMLMTAGFSLQLIGLLELCRRIGTTSPLLGLVTMLTSVLGTAGTILPSAVRIISAAQINMGIPMEQLNRVYGAADETADPLLIVLPFVLCFFLNYLLLAFGLWRARLGPRFAPILLVAGCIFFVMGQGSFEVNFPAYIAGVTAWLSALAPLGIRMLRTVSGSQGIAAEGAPGR